MHPFAFARKRRLTPGPGACSSGAEPRRPQRTPRPPPIGPSHVDFTEQSGLVPPSLRACPRRRPIGDHRPRNAREILDHCFPAYVGRQERTAFELMRRSIEQDCAVFLTFSGAMTPRGCTSRASFPLIERGLIDCITTTGANLYHDAHRVIGHRIREIEPEGGRPPVSAGAHHPHLRPWLSGGGAARDRQALFGHPSGAGVPEAHDDARASLRARSPSPLERALGVREPSSFRPPGATASPSSSAPFKMGRSSSMWSNSEVARGGVSSRWTSATTCSRWRPCSTTASHPRKPMAVWILGGGVPKNYTLQGEPLLDQIWVCRPTALTSMSSFVSTRSTMVRSVRAQPGRDTRGGRCLPKA